MRMDKLTIKAQEAVSDAQQRATNAQNVQIEEEHLLAALLGQTDGIIHPLLHKLGVNSPLLVQQIQTYIDRFPKVSGSAELGTRLSAKLQQAIQTAFDEAARMKDEYVSTEHLFLALVGDTQASFAQQLKA